MATTGSYYINALDGQIQQQGNPLLAVALRAAGYQGPYATIADAKAAIGGKDVAGDISSAASSAENSVFGRLFGGPVSGWLLRIAEGLLGLVLIAVGVAKLTHAIPVATAIAKKVP